MRLLAVFALAVTAPPAVAQDAAALRVFLDCGGDDFHCDFDHFRRSITFVDWVRDREVAQVHVLVTSQETGSGGDEFTLTFLGRGEFAGRADTLRHASSRTDTDSEVRDALTRTLAVGLVRYAAARGLAPRITIGYALPEPGAVQQAARDRWNHWVFSTGLSAEVAGESRQNALSLDGDLEASRTTEPFKIALGLRGEYERESFDLDDTTRIVSTARSWEVENITVWSLGPHWSAGFRGEAGASTFSNRDFFFEGGPVIEYDVFPYQESTRRLFTVALTAGLTYYDYEDVTIFDRSTELRPAHVLEIGIAQREPWGEIEGTAEWFQYWHDWDRHRFELDGGVEIRVVRGLSFDLFGSVARVKDQIYLSREDLTPAEILLRRRELGTDFRYSLDVGLSFTFGSIYNNIVNPRIER
jgi:hypothetical protein